MTTVFNGIQMAQQQIVLLKERVERLSYTPKLVSVVFQDDAMGMLYTNLKAQAAKEVGFDFEKIVIKSSDSNHRTIQTITELCESVDIHGLLIQKPRGIDKELWGVLTNSIDPTKDVDCLTRENLEKIYNGSSTFLPATARAVVEILATHTSRRDLEVVVVGRSELVGKPLFSYLKNQTSKIKMLGSKDDLAELKTADVVISATGKANLIHGTMVREGVIVIDVGEPKGDVDFATVVSKASFITPVPGGVGPMTVVSLLANMLELPVV